jgi:hypothetical protein
MNRILSTGLIGTAAVVALVAGTCAPAFAAGGGTTLAAIQASAKTKTSDRITSLNSAIATVNSAKDVSDADRATILAVLNNDLAGMSTVEAKIAADTTVATASADYKTIFTGYRVYAVAIPQARLAEAADRLTSTTIPRLTDAQTKLTAALNGPDASKSTPALQADLTDMQSQISSASSVLNGVSAESLAVTPADYNSNSAVMHPIRGAVTTAIADLGKASADAKTVLAAIQ